MVLQGRTFGGLLHQVLQPGFTFFVAQLTATAHLRYW